MNYLPNLNPFHSYTPAEAHLRALLNSLEQLEGSAVRVTVTTNAGQNASGVVKHVHWAAEVVEFLCDSLSADHAFETAVWHVPVGELRSIELFCVPLPQETVNSAPKTTKVAKEPSAAARTARPTSAKQTSGSSNRATASASR